MTPRALSAKPPLPAARPAAGGDAPPGIEQRPWSTPFHCAKGLNHLFDPAYTKLNCVHIGKSDNVGVVSTLRQSVTGRPTVHTVKTGVRVTGKPAILSPERGGGTT